MTDLEYIASALSDPEAERIEMDGAWERRMLRLAEPGALLAELERRYEPAHFALDVRRNTDGSYDLRVFDRASLKRVAQGSGPTLTAALRDLLGVDGG